jgi:hypothetical protein
MNRLCRTSLLSLTGLAGLGASGSAAAEPYIAVRTGYQCTVCHVNPSGGGLRTTFGDIYSQTLMPQQQLDLGDRGIWLGNVNDWFRIGSNFRYDYSYTDIPHQKRTDGFGVDDFRVYAAAELIRDRLSFYVDEAIAPGAVTNREAYALLWFGSRRYYVKAGQLYLPYGLRLQDDDSFVRQLTAINFTTPDNGVEFGWQHAAWSAQLAVTNGTAGAAPGTDQGKQATGSIVYVQPRWRFGGSYSYNDAQAGKRELEGLFAGLKTGPVAWLAEGDYVADGSISPRLRAYAGLLEGNWAFLRGNNLKLTAEYYKPNIVVEQNQRNRFSIVWEYTPIQFVQTRLGARRYGGIPQNDEQNEKVLFAELNLFF